MKVLQNIKIATSKIILTKFTEDLQVRVSYIQYCENKRDLCEYGYDIHKSQYCSHFCK